MAVYDISKFTYGTDEFRFKDGTLRQEVTESMNSLTSEVTTARVAAEEAKNYAQTFVGAPCVATSDAQMTDTSRIYVYTGTTSENLINGYWYYWDGSAWTNGGVYNSVAVQTDPTLTISGTAADAKATGDLKNMILKSFESTLTKIELTSGGYIQTNKNPLTLIKKSSSSFNNGGYAIVDCQPGDKFTISGTGGTAGVLWCFIDSDKAVIDKAKNSAVADGLVLIAPPSAAKLVINTTTNTVSYIGALPQVSKLNRLIEVGPDYAEYGSINSSGAPVDVDLRIRTGYLKAVSLPVTVNVLTGFTFNLYIYDENLNFVKYATGKTTYEINDYYYYRFVVVPNSGYEYTPRTSELSTIFLNSFDGLKCYSTGQDLQRIRNAVEAENDRFSLNRNLVGLDDMVWEYQNWVFPQVISYKGVRDSLYFGFTNADGYSGVAQYDYDTGRVTKTLLKKNYHADDHNLVSVLMMSNQKLLCVYAGGHNDDPYLYARIASSRESIETFDPAIRLTCATGFTSYSQVFEYNNKIYVFYRSGDYGWSYQISDDYGETWSDEVKLIQGEHKCYCQFTETTTAGVLRCLWYHNPSNTDTAIKMAFVHLGDMSVYDTDNATLIGDSNIDPSTLTTVIPVPDPNNVDVKNRLFNAAVTPIADTKILYCVFNVNNTGDGVYYVYDNGTSTQIADAGYALWVPKAQLGVAWIGTDKIAVARSANNNDIIEIYNYINGVVTLDKQVVSNSNIGDIRTARPMIDNHQRTMIYFHGYFNHNSFEDFKTDGEIYHLQEQPVVTIESGKYFLIGNTLYLSTTVIHAGDTIIPGTNCTKSNLAEALNALNA